MVGEYYKTKRTVEEYIRSAEGYNGKELIEKLRQVLSAEAKILEVGSGPGSDWEILIESYDVIGSDSSSEFIKYLGAKYPEGEFLELDAATLETDLKFDGIYSNKVLHHLSDEDLVKSVENQARILNTNGKICHSFWKGKGSEVFKGLFVNYHNEEDIRDVFGAFFEVFSLESYQEFEEGDSLLLIGAKK